jgi:hypothetical protein
MKILSKPTMSGAKDRALDYGAGALAGYGYKTLSNMTGSSFWGSALSAIGVALFMPGERGRVIATTLGFNAGMMFGGDNSGGDNTQEAIM